MNCLSDAMGLNFAMGWAGDDGRRWKLKPVVAKTSSPNLGLSAYLGVNYGR